MIVESWGAGATQSWVAEMAHAATGGLIAAVWQGVLLSLVVALGLRMLPKTPGAVRFAIWFGVFVVVAVLPWAGLLRGVGVSANGRRAWLMLDERWGLTVAAVWLIASLARAATLLLAAMRVWALWKGATPIEFARTEVLRGFGRFEELTSSRQAELCVSDDVDRPTVIGFFSPKILIPSWLVEKLTATEMKQILLHEGGHLSRADDWMNLLQKIALVVFPLNPALAWVERRLCFERELACDERVLAMTGAPKAYAACLASLAKHRLGRRGLALALGALGHESELGRRVRRILCRGERMRPLQAKLVLCGAMFGLMAAAVGLERCPAVVGFASPADGVAMASEPLRMDDHVGEGYRYQPVGYRAPLFHSLAVPLRPAAVRGLRTTAKRMASSSAASAPGNDTLLRSSLAEPTDAYRRTQGTGDGDGQSALGQSVRSKDVSGSDMVSEGIKARGIEEQPEVRSAVRLIVVTSWRGNDGSRMMLTTFRSANPAGLVFDGSGVTNAVPVQEQIYPYAAVPVRDGWLLIQL